MVTDSIATLSQGRSENKQAKLAIPPSPASTVSSSSAVPSLDDCPHLVYAFVEEQELADYVASYDRESERLVFVSIPGRDRGIRFARSIIKHFQDHLRENISKPFDYWWMIDDDLGQIRMYDTMGIVTSMNPCHLSLALLFTQKALRTEVDATFPLLDVGTLGEQIFPLFVNPMKLGIQLEAQKDGIYEAAASPVSALEYLCRGEWYSWMRGEDEEKKANLCTLVAEMVKWRRTLLENTNICQMAIANKNANETTYRRNYNLEVAEGVGPAHYRVAIERFGTVLNYAPPLRLHSYTRWYELFVPQYEVERRIIAEKKGNDGTAYFFLKEDKLLIKRLTKDKLGGFQLFKFDIEYGKQRTGGCWNFRKRTLTTKKKSNQPPTRPWDKYVYVNCRDQGKVIEALAKVLYGIPQREVPERVPFVEWYIRCHDAAEELTRQKKGSKYHFLQSAAEVFGVEIVLNNGGEESLVFNEQPTAPLIRISPP
jgi:hypothetical protein